ncbi:hypothetical protein FJTKL_06324 [Diaporthe vaccinii]|uniref:Cytochrome P450 n=1 Tax=Diaporthe vaccinii TaxID=105482 RepID=A0ABR4DQ70_9PEZI
MLFINENNLATHAPRLAATGLLAFLYYAFIRAIYKVYFHPLSKIPGPRTCSSFLKTQPALAPAFTPRAPRAQEPVLHRYVSLLVERLREAITRNGAKAQADIDMAPWFNFTTFDIFGDLGFGESFNCLENSRYHLWVALLFNSVKAASFVATVRFYPLLEWLLMKCIPPSLKKMQRKHFDQIVDKVHQRLNWELERPNIMSHVIGGKQVLDIGVINATFMVLTTAGSKTTATVLNGTLNYLVNNPDKLELLNREIRQYFQSEDEITLDALRGFKYLTACLNEGLRLCVPVPWMLLRLVPQGGATVCGEWLPGGTPIQPFSTGPRNCLGQYLAWAEMRLILAKLVWNFDIRVVPDKRLRWEDLRTFLLVKKKPIVVEMTLSLVNPWPPQRGL